jgi:hypothetical protein
MADPSINTAGMTDKVGKNVWYKALGGLSVWQVRLAQHHLCVRPTFPFQVSHPHAMFALLSI